MSDKNVILYISFVGIPTLKDTENGIDAQLAKCRSAISSIVIQDGGIMLENSSKQAISILNTPRSALSCASEILIHRDCGEIHIAQAVRIGINLVESNVDVLKQLHFSPTPLFLNVRARPGRIYVSEKIRSLVGDVDYSHAGACESVKGNIEQFYEAVSLPKEPTRQNSTHDNKSVKFEPIFRDSEQNHRRMIWLATVLVAILSIGTVAWFLPQLGIPDPQQVKVPHSLSVQPGVDSITKEMIMGDGVDTLGLTLSHEDKESDIPSLKTDTTNIEMGINETSGYENERFHRTIINQGTDLHEFTGVITFDDGPHPSTTPVLLRLLTEAKVQNAVFFFVGYRILEYPELVSQVINAGYKVGYHSMFHQNLAHLSTQKIRKDIQDFRLVINNAIGANYNITLGRPTFGGMTSNTVQEFRRLERNGSLATIPMNSTVIRNLVHPNIIRAFEEEQLQPMLWNVDFDDWESKLSIDEALLMYSAIVKQVWLLHERPINWTRLTGFENNLAERFPELLYTLSQLQQKPRTLQDLTWHVQRRLTELGYDPGPSDGTAGTKTHAAIRAFQSKIGLPATDKIDMRLLETLRSASTTN